MEFTDYEKAFLWDIEHFARDEIFLMNNTFSAAQVETYEHTMDNMSMDTSFGEMIHKLRQYGYNFLGVGIAPWVHSGRDMAVIFEDNITFQKYWYHIDSYLIEWWKEQIDLFLGKEKE